MFDFFHGWRRKAVRAVGHRPMPDLVIEIVTRQLGVTVDNLRTHPACKDLDSMTSVELVELVATLTDHPPSPD